MVSEESMKQLLSELTKPPKITIALSRWKGINFFFLTFIYLLSTSKLGKWKLDVIMAMWPSLQRNNHYKKFWKSNSTFFFFLF